MAKNGIATYYCSLVGSCTNKHVKFMDTSEGPDTIELCKRFEIICNVGLIY